MRFFLGLLAQNQTAEFQTTLLISCMILGKFLSPSFLIYKINKGIKKRYGLCDKAYQGVIRNLQRVRLSCFENCCKTAKQIPTGFKV